MTTGGAKERDASTKPDERARRAIEHSLQRYGIDRWGREFLSASPEGHVLFKAPGYPAVDLQRLVEALSTRGINTPFVVRFPSMIVQQIERLRRAFDSACEENAYAGGHIGLFPLKVNQRRSVVDTVVRAREANRYGLEAGSKPELLLAMAQPVAPNSPLVCNGFKDREFIRMAFHAAELGHRVILVIESIREVRRYLDVYAEHDWRAFPELGVRAKLYSRGSGRWSSSGGESSKFGLMTDEILAVVRELEDANLSNMLVLLHFHIGSQITQIKRIKQAVREAARVYAALQPYCPALRLLDLGGGIGVDYDGSRTSYPSSANYTLEEYASQVVFEVSEVCDETGTPEPTILTESGRIIVAQHAVTIAELREVQGELLPIPEPDDDDDHRLVQELRYTLEHITAKNVEEYFHDAIDYRDECLQLFSIGHLSIEDRASAEGLFHRIRNRVQQITEGMSRPPEEITDYLGLAQRKYLANFSIFQSLPDVWSISQVFPAAPLSRHTERPTVAASLVDITCDSDGCVSTFAHPDENLPVLPLHQPRGRAEPYFLGFFMTGAYQDSLANMHNLFGDCHEVVLRDPDDDIVLPGSERVELSGNLHFEFRLGATCEDVLSAMDFDVDTMIKSLRDRHLGRKTTLGQAWAMGVLQSYPYLTNE
ncbi:MAG: biosynthetic arginine decarboxylase [Myxococcales bacterium]|nr:biosynthetic arginine decarboxylase [Myxococcales bacterium]MCB9750413.1 biosynthetic arginine decarboxylase [Myxococcales bacterium]